MQALKFTDRHVVLAAVLGSVICLAYFQTLDLMGFSTAKFAPIFQLLLSVYDYRTACLTTVACLIAAFWKPSHFGFHLADSIGDSPKVVCLMASVVASIGALVIYKNYPLSMDEYAAAFQARVFASGHIVARLPHELVDWLVPRGFNGSFLIASRITGRTIEQYWPGFALLLAPFEWLGIGWACNAVLAGLSLFFIHSITLTITGERRAAGWAVLFACASGAFLANAISYYSMQAHLTLNLVFAWLLIKPTHYRACAAGIVGSIALVLHNPVPHTLFAVPWVLAIVFMPERRRYAPSLLLGYLPLSLVLGVGWLALRTSIAGSDTAADVMSITAHAVVRFPTPTMLSMRIAALAKLWVWGAPGIFLLALAGRLRHSDNLTARLLTYSAVLTFVGYMFVNLDQGHGWGYRYFHGAFGAIPILAGCALSSRCASTSWLRTFAPASVILGFAVIVPFQMSQIHGFVVRHLAQLPEPKRPGNNVYFIQVGGGSYMGDMIQTDPYLRSVDLFLGSRGAVLDAELIRQNWPDAVKIPGGFWNERWYLGPSDHRVSVSEAPAPHWVVTFSRVP